MTTHSNRSVPVKTGWIFLYRDLVLRTSLSVARFIVWRTLRAKHKERLARLKNLKLVQSNRNTLNARETAVSVRLNGKGHCPHVVAETLFVGRR